jgi:hypothetical protein
MALPKLNDSPKYEITIPSTGTPVRYRPYLVKEEKVLMMAFESGDQKQTLAAIVDTLRCCIQDPIEVNTLTTFDIEYLFTQIRSKSVGETAEVLLKCSECGHKNQKSIDISSVKVTLSDKSKIIELTPNVSIEMKYPSYLDIQSSDLNGDDLTVGFDLVASCISAIMTEDERISTSEVSKSEVIEFIESMTQDQFKKLGEFLESMPAMMHTENFVCEKCEADNSVTLKGMQDFLS